MEFAEVNEVAGSEPLQQELSDLRTKPATVPWYALNTLTALRYLWQPSEEHRRRQEESRQMNHQLHIKPRTPVLPPILGYREETETVTPIRFQPSLEEDVDAGGILSVEERPRDLKDLEQRERRRSPRMIGPLVPETDEVYLATDRPLLPRQYRAFLHHSAYARTVVTAVVVALTIGSLLWISQSYQAEAVAAGRYHAARSSFQRALDKALAYGVDASTLRPLETMARSLAASSVPFGIVIDRSRLDFYRSQEREYRTMLARLHLIEMRTMRYWTWREGVAYAPLMGATHAAAALGLPASAPIVPACDTPACFHAAIGQQSSRTAWLLETAATLRIYASRTSAAPDPAAAAATRVQEAETLRSLVPSAAPPVSTASLPGMLATATTPQEDARVGALAHLDADALHLALVRALPHRAIVISLEEESMALYQSGRVVYRSPIAAGPSVPIGVFHIQARQTSVSALYWENLGQYVSGSIPDWMPFSGDSALQAAPWQASFGPSSSPTATNAPQTPRSVDLPPPAADFLFHWCAIGTEVAVY
ncbi:MAG: L,D-transpeptidase [Chloroflexota bacterium]|nr:L,D-transpeptidase [Chloroflexota bacterium]